MWLGGWHVEGVLWGAQQRGPFLALPGRCAAHPAACAGGLHAPLLGDPALAWLQVLLACPVNGSWAGRRAFSLCSRGTECTGFEYSGDAEMRPKLTFSEKRPGRRSPCLRRRRCLLPALDPCLCHALWHRVPCSMVLFRSP